VWKNLYAKVMVERPIEDLKGFTRVESKWVLLDRTSKPKEPLDVLVLMSRAQYEQEFVPASTRGS